ncbi:MAG: hypothetical protein RLZZ223_82 [Candidatus Parcubacteria bacterium]|jgi:D-alanyl-D-alanine carboxypeptidase
MKSKHFYWWGGAFIVVVFGIFLSAYNQAYSDNNINSDNLGILHHIPILDMPSRNIEFSSAQTLVPAPIARFQKKSENLSEPSITAESALVVDFATGDILFSKNALDKHELASITKILSAMVVMDEYKWDTNRYLTMTQTAFDTYGGNSLQVDDKFLTEDILRASLMVSSNDAAQLLAENFGGVDKFVLKMNQKAKSIQMQSSQFFNSHGLDQEPTSNYSTASDVMKLTQDLYDNYPDLMAVLRQKEVFIKSQSGKNIRLGNTNEMLGVDPQMLVGKTGLTDQAGETFSSVVSIQNRVVGIVVLNSSIGGYRFQDTRNLIKWIEDNYSI